MSSFSSAFTELPGSLDELLDMPLTGTGANTAQLVANKNYQKLQAFGNVTSFSMQAVFKTCPREFQLMKLAAATRTPIAKDNVDHAFGHAIGAAIATYDQTGDYNKALLQLFLAWSCDLFATDDYKKIPKNKSFHSAVVGLQLYIRFREEELYFLDEYEIVQLEHTFSLDLENGNDSEVLGNPPAYYVGHIDEIYKHKTLGSYLVKENKTTGSAVVAPADWSNSEQTTSYSAVISALGAQSYDVLYAIYSSTTETWHYMSFPKTRLAKIHFLQDQLFIAEDIDRYSKANFFPKRGANCIRFGRECEFYGLCDLDTTKQFGMKFSDLPIVTDTKQLDEVETYHQHIKLSDIIEAIKDDNV